MISSPSLDEPFGAEPKSLAQALATEAVVHQPHNPPQTQSDSDKPSVAHTLLPECGSLPHASSADR